MPKLDSETFNTYLHAEVAKLSAGQILSYGDVYTCLAEHLNNVVIEQWEKDNPLPGVESQIEVLKPDWAKLVSSLIPEIQDDFRASEFDDEDSEPSMCLTIGFTPETREKDCRWGWQTGDNSFTGGAYSHPHWAVVTLTRDCNPGEIAEEIADQIAELAHQ